MSNDPQSSRKGELKDAATLVAEGSEYMGRLHCLNPKSASTLFDLWARDNWQAIATALKSSASSETGPILEQIARFIEGDAQLSKADALRVANMVRIWSGEHRAWWRPDGCGYTPHMIEAGIYTRWDAERRTKHCDPSKMIEIQDADKAPQSSCAATVPLPNTTDEERVRDLAQRMVGRWNGPSEMLVAFLRLLLKRPESASSCADTVAVPRLTLEKWERMTRVRGEELHPVAERPSFLHDGLADEMKAMLKGAPVPESEATKNAAVASSSTSPFEGGEVGPDTRQAGDQGAKPGRAGDATAAPASKSVDITHDLAKAYVAEREALLVWMKRALKAEAELAQRSATTPSIPNWNGKVPADPAKAMGKLFSKVDAEDMDTLNWLFASVRQTATESALSSTAAPLATSDPEGHRQAIADAEHDRLVAEAGRYRWLRDHLYGADFQYGSEGEDKIPVLLFRLPDGMRVSADLDATIDQAPRSATAPSGSDNSERPKLDPECAWPFPKNSQP